jgi:hypothetical protein
LHITKETVSLQPLSDGRQAVERQKSRKKKNSNYFSRKLAEVKKLTTFAPR